MIIRAPRISCNPAGTDAGGRPLVVVPGQEEKCFCIRKHTRRVRTPNRVACKPSHVAVRTRLQPGTVFSGVGGRPRARESAQVESALLGKIFNPGLHGVWLPRHEAPEESDLQLPDD